VIDWLEQLANDGIDQTIYALENNMATEQPELSFDKYKREGYDVLHVTVAEQHNQNCFKGDILVLYRSKKAPYSVKSTIAGNIYD